MSLLAAPSAPWTVTTGRLDIVSLVGDAHLLGRPLASMRSISKVCCVRQDFEISDVAWQKSWHTHFCEKRQRGDPPLIRSITSK